MLEELAVRYFKLHAGKRCRVVGVYFDTVNCVWKFNVRKVQ